MSPSLCPPLTSLSAESSSADDLKKNLNISTSHEKIRRRSLYAVARIGGESHRTRTVSGSLCFNWNQTFSFTISLHGQLFDTFYIDIWEARWMRFDIFIGRVHLKLSTLKDMPETFTR